MGFRLSPIEELSELHFLARLRFDLERRGLPALILAARVGPTEGSWSLVTSLESDSSGPQGEWARLPCLAIYVARDVARCEI